MRMNALQMSKYAVLTLNFQPYRKHVRIRHRMLALPAPPALLPDFVHGVRDSPFLLFRRGRTCYNGIRTLYRHAC
jgi:hypothetical protein